MTTPTPAGSSAAGIPMSTPSPLATYFGTTPRGTSIALSSLQVLAETQLVLVLLDHPTIRRKWRTVVVPLVETISKKLNTIYSGSRLTIGCVVYRPTADKSLLRPSWTLSRTKLQPGSKLIASNLHTPEFWLGPDSSSNLSSDADPATSTYALIDGRSTSKPTAHVLEAFVAALELLQPTQNGIRNPLAPKKPPVLARHLLHVCLDSSEVSLDISSPPFFNADSANDRVTAPTIGGRLAKLGVSISSCAVKSDLPNAASSSSSKEALAAILGLHKSVSEPAKLANEDLATLLPEAVRTKVFSSANIISSGLTPSSDTNKAGNTAPAAPTGTSTKRTREDEADLASTPIKRSKSGSISQPQSAPKIPNTANASSSSTASASGEMQRNVKLDPSISTKVLFLRSQQETMIKNWATAYAAVSKAEAAGESAPAKAPGMNKAYLEQLKAQLMTQQQALKMLVHRIISGAETSPNFNASLQSLINIDKEAREMGVNLGGPGGGTAALARPGRSGSLTGGQQPPTVLPTQQSLQPTATSAVKLPVTAAHLHSNPTAPIVPPAAATAVPAPINTSTSHNTTAPLAAGPPPSPTRPKPFWRGALTWSVISDPVTKQKRDVATLVSATSNSSTLDRLLMPWPDKLQITAITQLAPRNLQVYAQSQNAPYILFSTPEADTSDEGGPVLTAATAEKNKQMYLSLASSLEAKKSCAFIRHGSNAGAGLVVFATTQPTNSAERSAKGPVPTKLIGVVLKDTIPFTKLLAAQNSAQQQQGARPNKPLPPHSQTQTQSHGANASGNMLPAVSADASNPAAQQPALASSAPQQPQQQQQQPSSGMGLGPSMPFSLAALSAAGNIPVSGVGGATSGSSAGMNIGSTAMPNNAPQAATNLPNLGNLGNHGNFTNLNNLANFNFGNLMGGGQQQQPSQDTFGGGSNSSAAMGPPNLAALAQFLGIGGQSGSMQPPQPSQQQQAFSQALPQSFGQTTGGFQQQHAGQQQSGMFNNLNPFNVTAQPHQMQQQPVPQQQQQQPHQQQQGSARGGGDASGGGMDFSKPMTMEQLRALGFIQ